MEKYLVAIDQGEGGTSSVWAATATEALAEAIVWAKRGDWTYPAAFRVSVMNEDDASDTASALVEIDNEGE
jgi:hypothetical protein